MCGIIGVFGKEQADKLVKKGLKVIEYRGKDGQGFYNGKNQAIGHCLYAIINFVKQPLIRKTIFAANCEIYNWKELSKKYNFKPKNDADLMHLLLDKKGIDAINEFKGVYAFSYLKGNELYLIRDIIGLFPLWYSTQDGLAFASEKKALEKIGYLNIEELNPRKILVYNTKTKKIRFIERDFLKITPEIKTNKKTIIENINKLLTKALIGRTKTNKKIGLLFSGGVDSTLLALILKQNKIPFTCYTTALEDKNLKVAEDLGYAKRAAKDLDLDLKIIKIKTKTIPSILKKIIPIIESTDVTKVGVALTFYSACKQAKKDGCHIIISGLGSEEIFAGYQRHKDAGPGS